MTTSQTATCGRMIAALDHAGHRTLRPCAKTPGHPGHCHYDPAAEVRPTEPICPPWCSGHDETYQSWEEGYNGKRSRDHSERAAHITGTTRRLTSASAATTAAGTWSAYRSGLTICARSRPHLLTLADSFDA